MKESPDHIYGNMDCKNLKAIQTILGSLELARFSTFITVDGPTLGKEEKKLRMALNLNNYK